MRRALPIFTAAIALCACNQKEDADHRVPAGPGQTVVGAAQSDQPKPGGSIPKGCDGLPDSNQLKAFLKKAPEGAQIGGLFEGRAEWGAVVDRWGELCAVAVASDDAAAAWPGSQAIAKAKAYTANAFSTDQQPMSTARLYTLSQPGHSLWGAAAGNPIDPKCLVKPGAEFDSGEICGGTIAFGGGVPLYKNQTRVGGLGISGDTACADHEIAKRVRDAAGLNPQQGPSADDIQYSSVDKPSIYSHPLCINTWRNGKKIGDEPAAQGY